MPVRELIKCKLVLIFAGTMFVENTALWHYRKNLKNAETGFFATGVSCLWSIFLAGLWLYLQTRLHPETYFLHGTRLDTWFPYFCFAGKPVGSVYPDLYHGPHTQEHFRRKCKKTGCSPFEYHWELFSGEASPCMSATSFCGWDQHCLQDICGLSLFFA